MSEKLSVFVPLRVAPSDAFTLNEAAKSRNVARSELMRQLIRSLISEKPEASTAARFDGCSLVSDNRASLEDQKKKR